MCPIILQDVTGDANPFITAPPVKTSREFLNATEKCFHRTLLPLFTLDTVNSSMFITCPFWDRVLCPRAETGREMRSNLNHPILSGHCECFSPLGYLESWRPMDKSNGTSSTPTSLVSFPGAPFSHTHLFNPLFRVHLCKLLQILFRTTWKLNNEAKQTFCEIRY